MYHGFRLTRTRENFKKREGYVIPATDREDSNGIDFWIKMPRDMRLFPVQITQRGVKMYKRHHTPSLPMLQTFLQKSEERIAKKRQQCNRSGVAFVLVRDYEGGLPSTTIAWGDVKAIRNAIQQLCRTIPAVT